MSKSPVSLGIGAVLDHNVVVLYNVNYNNNNHHRMVRHYLFVNKLK